MKKTLLTLCMVLSLSACKEQKKPQVQEKPVIKIGAILPLSGPQASMGEAAKAGMMKALKEKTNSNQHYTYQFAFEDNQAKLSSMLAIANKLVMQDNVDVLVTSTSAMAKVIAPVSNEKEKVLYNFSIEEEKYPRFGKYTFTQGISVETVVDKTIEFFIKNGINNVAVFVENIGVLGPLSIYFETKLSEQGIRYRMHAFNPGEMDFRIVIEKAKADGYTDFMLAGFPPEKFILLRQISEAGIENHHIYAIGLDMDKISDVYSGVRTVTYNSGPDEFIESIQREYKLDSIFHASDSYDFVSLMIEAYEALYKKGQKPTAEEITSYIHHKKEFPCMGGTCVVNPNGFITNTPIFRLYENGQWKTIEE